ncbi:hypothetical protein KFL_001970130 [Klebsormidium nitens]|uniref:F-box domain-containing protein n=1 Tax=Klebsormidium nitens TaxID=105231 RepID=A0A1Y1I3T6_KLENI|nr:hypothetical protein KFL_001970130 [Klebsormidium nitens]|eukprot:GAQ84612.1 hypothetical protein KFL_001970130 [Klebsormidium nitens]
MAPCKSEQSFEQKQSATMEILPGELVRVVLSKLAAQDPPSLLRATCACKAIYREVEGDSKFWKDGFFGGDSDIGEHCKDESLEAEILLVGGYKRLVKARWEVTESSGFERSRELLSPCSSKTSSFDGSREINVKYLVLVRDQKRLILWGFLKFTPSGDVNLGDLTLTADTVKKSGQWTFLDVSFPWVLRFEETKLLICPNVSNAQALPANQSLPEPTLVNEFLLSNQLNWTNPVLGKPPRPLQVIKCQSLTKPVYDFYRIEAPTNTCQIPPPVVNVLHPKHTPKVLRILLGITIFLGVVIDGLSGSGSNSDQQTPPVVCFKTKEGKKARKRNPLCQGLLILTYVVTLPVLVYLIISVARMVPGGVKCFTTDTRVERLGPVPLPDPAKGLNQYLASRSNGTSLTLQSCKNDRLQIYALAPDGCGRLADPYGGRSPDNELPARIRAMCPKLLNAWSAKDLVYGALPCLAMAIASWFLVLDCSLPLCECEECKKKRQRRAEVATQTEEAPRQQPGGAV